MPGSSVPVQRQKDRRTCEVAVRHSYGNEGRRAIDRFDGPEAFYADVVHSLDGIVWEADPATFQFLFVSRQAEAILGYPVREWLEDAAFWRRHTHPDDIAWCTAYCIDATAKNRNHSFDYRMIAADGRAVWLRDIVTVHARADGTKRLVGIMLDITQQKRAELERQDAVERVRRREEWFRRLIEHAWDTTFVVDRQGAILFVSPSITRVLGYAPKELESGNALELTNLQDAVPFRSFLAKVFNADDAGEELEYRARHKNGRERVLQIFGARSHDDDGREVAILNARDVTEKKALEAQLVTSQKMEAIGLLAGSIAHDFNNLLTVIRGYAETLRDGASARESNGEVEEIRRAADRAAVLTQQLLAFSRKQVVRPTTFDVNATITEISRLLSRLIGENIRLQVHCGKDVPPILADQGQVEQVLMNLAVNARDAMPFGGVLTIATAVTVVDPSLVAYELTGGRYVTVTVSDTGSGIAPDIQSRVFEPFFTTKDPGKGTGLGLSTAYGIMRQAHGHIAVHSEAGAGSTFTLYFPESHEPLRAGGLPKFERASRGSETVLVVEDEAAVRRLAVRVLASQGYRVLTAANGMDALEQSRSHEGEIALVLTDIVMPGMSGPEFVERLTLVRPKTAVIYMSGYAGDAVAYHGVMESGISFIPKPFSPQGLASAVREVLDNRDAD